LAERAFSVLLPSDSYDADLFLERGRLRVLLSQQGYKYKIAEAVQDLDRAANLSKQKGFGNPELQLIDLELAEAYFFNSDFKNADRAAEEFLAKRHGGTSHVATYEPVAYLLKYASEALEASGPQRQQIDNLQADIKSYSQWPVLTIPIASGTKKPIDVPISEWRFENFDRYVCGISQPQRELVLEMSRSVQARLQPPEPDKQRPMAPCSQR
jgi:hypothetical protein